MRTTRSRLGSRGLAAGSRTSAGQTTWPQWIDSRRSFLPSKVVLAIALVLLILVAPSRSSGQSSEIWLDYFRLWQHSGEWSFEANPGMAKGLTDPVWLEMYLSGNATYQPIGWLSTEGNLETHYTFNTTSEDFLEIRPWLGLNLIWARYGGPLHIFYPSISLRMEERLFWYQNGESESKQRLRLRISARFPLNNETLVPETYYLLFLAEQYFPIEGEAKEVSADKRRFQAGLGYVLAADLRIELEYIMMRSRNTQLNTFETSNHIIWLAVRNFF